MNRSSPPRVPESPALSPSQLAKVAELGEERTADAGDVLFQVGDDRYPFIAILEGEVAILDGAGNEIVRQGPSNFLGELNLLSGQSAFLTAVVKEPLRYIAVEREALRALLFDDGPLSDLLLATFIARREALQQVAGLGLEIVGPHSSAATRRLLDFARNNRLPVTWRDPEREDDPEAAALVAGLDASSLPLVRLPGGVEMRAPSFGELSRALGIGRELAPREEVDLLVVGAGPAGLGAAVYGAPRASTRSSLTAPRSAAKRVNHAGSRTTSAFRLGSAGPSSRAGRSAGAQVRRPAGDAVPGGRTRAGKRTARRPARGGAGDRRARCAARDRRRVPAASGRWPVRLRRAERLLRRGPAGGASSAAHHASPSSAEETQPGRPRSGSRGEARS